MDEIRSWWEVPCIAHYCYLFRRAFKLPPFEIEELEDALLIDHNPDPSSLLAEVHATFLTGICGKLVTEENWCFMLKLHLEWRVEYLKEGFNPLPEDKEYKNLTTREKVEVLHKLCHWRLELDDIADLLRGLEALDLRLDPLGKDNQGHTYWYFYGTRLYREPTELYKQRAKARLPQSATATPSSSSTAKSRKKGKAKKAEPPPDDDDSLSEPASKVSWELLCTTSEEWEDFTESLRGNKQSYDRALFRALNDEILPDVLQAIAAKEKKYKKKMLLDAPRRQSSRIALKAEEHLAALEREKQREQERRQELEEMKVQEELAAENRKKAEEEAKQKAEEEAKAMEQIRKQEEQKWEMALSGELSGPRKAAVGASENVADAEGETERDEELYTSMYKVCNDVRKHDDGWVFVDPVTDEIAPGYSDIIKQPMDIVTIEKKLAESKYTCLKEFSDDFHLMFDNCYEYNGSDSEYAEVADNVKKFFKKLCKKYFNEAYLKDKEEHERTPSPERLKAVKELEEEESESESSESGTDSDSDFGSTAVKVKGRKHKGKQPEDQDGNPSPWPQLYPGQAPNGLNVNPATIENLRRLGANRGIPPGMPQMPPIPPNIPPHLHQEYYAKFHEMQRRKYYQEMMMRRQFERYHQRAGAPNPYPRYPAPPGMEGMQPPPHGMPPHMAAPPGMYPQHPDQRMMHAYQQQQQGQHPYPYPPHGRMPYPGYPPPEHYQTQPPPDYEVAKMRMAWQKDPKGMPMSPAGDGAVRSPLPVKLAESAGAPGSPAVKSPLPPNMSQLPATQPNVTESADALKTKAKQPDEQVSDQTVDNNDKGLDPQRSTDSEGRENSVDNKSVGDDKKTPASSDQQDEDASASAPSQNDAYKKGVEAAYKFYQDQLKKQQHEKQPTANQPATPENQEQDASVLSPKSQQQAPKTPMSKQESYMRWRQQQEAMYRQQQMGMPTPPHMGPGGRSPMMHGGMGYPGDGREEAMRREYQMQQYMMNQRYMEDMYRRGYGYPPHGGAPYSPGYPPQHGHPSGYPRHPSQMHPPEGIQKLPSQQQESKPPNLHQKADMTPSKEEIPDYNDSLRKYAMGLAGFEGTAVAPDKDNTLAKEESGKGTTEEPASSVDSESLPSETSKADADNTKADDTESSSAKTEQQADSKEAAESQEDSASNTDSNVDRKKPMATSSTTTVPTSSTAQSSNAAPTDPAQTGRPTAPHNGYKTHPPGYPPPQDPHHMYGGWGGMPPQHPYDRGMYPPSMGRPPEGMEEYERYRAYQEQMMSMQQQQQMAMDQYYHQHPYQQSHHRQRMAMPSSQGMPTPHEMEQYHQYEMMQQQQQRRMAMPPHQIRHGYPPAGPGFATPEEMKQYQEQQMAAMQRHHQMRTAYMNHQQQQRSPRMPVPADYSGEVKLPPSHDASSGGAAKSLAPPDATTAANSTGSVSDASKTPVSPENRLTNHGVDADSAEEPPAKKAKLEC